MTPPTVDEVRNFTNSLISGLASRDVPPSKEDVEQKAAGLAKLFGYDGDLDAIVNEAMVSVNTRMGSGVSLVDVTAKHDAEWVQKRSDIDWTYTTAYGEYMREQGWGPQVIQSLQDVTERILGYLEDPASEGSTWNRRGLVIGHVQSGKTANYNGLIARAADAGYKFIVVLAGIHNNLRKQTQQRIDTAFIGRSSNPEDRRKIGVGLVAAYPNPVTLTNVNDDFNKQTAAKSGWQLNDFSKPIVLVIKKNVRTLDALHGWLKDLNATGDGRIRDVPMLLIDDEADNASVNTNKEDLDPTRTNTMIRTILGLFAKSCYVGYTATPFANIFINPDAYDDAAREELFPRDFIYCLDAPTNYFGAQKVFVDDETDDTFVRPIDDCEDFLPLLHKKDDEVIDLPPSLYKAIDEFVVARAIRGLRGQEGKHCSMMINVSRFVAVQKSVRDFVSLRVTRLRQAVHANAALPDTVALKDEYMRGLHQAYENEYSAAGETWSSVKTALWEVFEHLRVYVVNSKSADGLDYTSYEKEGVGLTAIAIGGLSLSRGLTIEGLTVSYMYRNTRMYDTLMQMGRWFGYRTGYEDLCRVHLSRDSSDWYAYIANASEELVQQVNRMRRDKLSPKDFGLYVRSHPDRLLVTARNKMRAGEKITVEQSLSGRQRESAVVSVDPEINERNFALIKEFWEQGFGGLKAEETGKGPMFRDVNLDTVDKFLRRFECHSEFASVRKTVLDYLARIAKKHSRADVVLVSPPNGQGGDTPFTLKRQVRAVAKDQPEGMSWTLNKRRVASRGDEKLGLSEDQKRRAEVIAHERGKPEPSDVHFRMVRDKPLLMLHSLQPGEAYIPGPVAAFGVSFPFGDYSTTINVVVNQVWLQKMQGYDDDPDDEDDFDE